MLSPPYLEWDSDGDGIADSYDDDIDGDWYTNQEEIDAGTDPNDYMSSPSEKSQRWLQERLSTAGGYVSYMNYNFDFPSKSEIVVASMIGNGVVLLTTPTW